MATLEIPVVGLSSVAFSPDGSHAVTYEYGRNGLVVKVYDLTVGEVLSVEPGGDFGFYGPNTVGWSPDGRFFAFVGGRDLRLFDVSTGEVIELDDDLAPNLQIAGVA